MPSVRSGHFPYLRMRKHVSVHLQDGGRETNLSLDVCHLLLVFQRRRAQGKHYLIPKHQFLFVCEKEKRRFSVSYLATRYTCC
jgi:hypothetical protein